MTDKDPKDRRGGKYGPLPHDRRSGHERPQDTRILLLPGLGGSAAGHWQSIWARRIDRCRIVRQADWDRPERADWLAALAAEVEQLDGRFALVGHSIGCALAAHWVIENLRDWANPSAPQLTAVMMVAPADVDSPDCTPDIVRSFAPIPRLPLPSKSLVVASEDDPYVAVETARDLADRWRSAFVSVGRRGHINADSGLGAWPEGLDLLGSLLAEDIAVPEKPALRVVGGAGTKA